jgi:rhamnogalacturonan endolyase
MHRTFSVRVLKAPLWLAASLLLALVAPARMLLAQASAAPAAVTVTDNGKSWTLDNGIVKATVSKDTGFMPSLIYHGRQILQASGGTWEHTPQGAPILTNTLTIDPAANGGERGEVAVKGVTNGTFMLTRSAPGGGTSCDMEIRYSLGKGDSGIYVYAIFNHPASYPAAGTGGEDRYIMRLNQSFDWITVDKDRNMLEAAPTDWGTGVVVHAKEQRIMSKGVYKNSVEHKYSYSGMQYVTKAYGWSDTTNHIGAWFINPTIEYLSGGPTRIDLDAHFGDNGDPEPIILDYWHSGHYSGASTRIAAGEQWTKVIGPIFVYVNSLDHPVPTTQAERDTLAATAGNPTVPASWTANANALWTDATKQWKTENTRWPYEWVKGVDYTPLAERGTVTGRIVLDDPLAPKGSSKKLPHLVVGLTHADAVAVPGAAIPGGAGGGFGGGGFGGGAAGSGAAPAPAPAPGLRPAPAPGEASGAAGATPGAGGARGFGRGGFGGGGGFGAMNTGPGSWMHEAKYYQFFNDGTEDGKFAITKVRPGTYTLHATADGVLGDFAQANVTVVAGKTIDLGKLVWKPVRFGQQAWEIGYPDRAAKEFLKGDGQNYWLWGWNLRYALLFPNGLTYTVGKSDWHKDWFFEEVPTATNLSFVNPAANDPANQRFGWVKAESLTEYPQTNQSGPWARYGRGKETVWTIKFNMAKPGHGLAALRAGIAGVNGLRQGLAVRVNGQYAGAIGDGRDPDNMPMRNSDAIRYNTDKGLWQERTLKFDASVLKAGENTMTFTVPAGGVDTGIVWDYLRLELDAKAKGPALPPVPAPAAPGTFRAAQ